MNSVFSTLTASVKYAQYKPGAADMPVCVATVEILGGRGLADKHLITPEGVRTEVSDADLAVLESLPLFQLHKANGFIKVYPGKPEIEKVVKDMAVKDASAPLTPEDFKHSDVEVITSKDGKKSSNKK